MSVIIAADSAQAQSGGDLLDLLAPLPRIGTNLAVALDLARHGCSVFPCREMAGVNRNGETAGIKSPYTDQGHHDASRNLDQIQAWWRKWPDALVGLPTGKRNGFDVLDLDRHRSEHDGVEALRTLGFQPKELSPFTVSTAGGGLHIYFLHHAGLRNGDAHLPPGINVRAEGGYVIAPGAVLPDGRRYVANGAFDRSRLNRWPNALLPAPDFDLSKLIGDTLPVDWAEVRRAVGFISPDCSRDEWVRVGMALHAASGGDHEAFELWDSWSSGATEPGKYQSGVMRGQWRSFGRRNGIDIGTLFHIAGEYGWSRGPDVCGDDFDDLDNDLTDLLYDDRKPTSLFEPASSWAVFPAKAREWLVEGLIPNGVVTMLNGDGGAGKSLLALQLAVATASGGNWIGRTVDRPGKALFFSAEDSRDELHRRLEAICGDRLASLDRLLIRSFVDADPLLATFDKQNTIRMTALFGQLAATMEHERPSLVVLDTLADLHTGDENNRSHARQLIGKLKGLAGRFNCAVLLLAHPSRSGMADGTGASGSTGWNNSVRSRLYLTRVLDSHGREWDDKARTLSTVKANYGARGGTIDLRWHDGAFIAAGDPFDAPESRPAKAERVFLKLLDRFTSEGTYVSRHPSATYAPRQFAEQPDNESCPKDELEGAMNRLFIAGRLRNGTHRSNRQERSHIEKVEYSAFHHDEAECLV